MNDELDLFETTGAAGQSGSATLSAASMSRRHRVLLHLEPLLRLRQQDLRAAGDEQHYDSLAVALRILDIIADEMGFATLASPQAVFRRLQPLLDRMDEAALVPPSPGRQRRYFDRLLDRLRNVDEGHRPFRITWTDVDDEGAVAQRVLSFRLVEDAFGFDGQPALRLSPTAVNLVFSALEMDVEDAQTATEAIVQSQIRRGRFSQALQSARNALNQSQLYDVRLQSLLQLTRRDVGRVDWSEQAPALLSDALDHLEERLQVEASIRASARERLNQLAPGSTEARYVARIDELVSRCVSTHMRLQRRLLEVRSIFLDSQARQSFIARRKRIVRSLYHDALEPLMALPAADAQGPAEGWISDVVGCVRPSCFDLRAMVEGLLSPRQQRRLAHLEEEGAQEFIEDRDRRHFSDEEQANAEAMLANLDKPATLSALIRRAEQEHTPSFLVALRALALFDGEGQVGEHVSLSVDKTGRRVRHGDWFFDELTLAPRAPEAGASDEDPR